MSTVVLPGDLHDTGHLAACLRTGRLATAPVVDPLAEPGHACQGHSPALLHHAPKLIIVIPVAYGHLIGHRPVKIVPRLSVSRHNHLAAGNQRPHRPRQTAIIRQ